MQPSGGYLAHPGDGATIYAPGEFERARRRPKAEQTPIPQVGDRLFYRHREGSPNVYAVEVVAVQSLEDFSDPNLWYLQTDAAGQPRYVEGQLVLAQAHDPWPMVTLELVEPIVEDHLPAGIQFETREARMRGSVGWLPLDYATRAQAAPSILIVRSR